MAKVEHECRQEDGKYCLLVQAHLNLKADYESLKTAGSKMAEALRRELSGDGYVDPEVRQNIAKEALALWERVIGGGE